MIRGSCRVGEKSRREWATTSGSEARGDEDVIKPWVDHRKDTWLSGTQEGRVKTAISS